MKKNIIFPFKSNNFQFAFCHLLFAFCFLLVSCTPNKEAPKVEATNKKADDKTVFCVSDTLKSMIQLGTVNLEQIQDVLQVAGEVTFNQDKVVRVMPITSGQVLDVTANLGSYVNKGQVLATIKSFENVNNASDQRYAQAEVAISKKNLEATEGLFKSGLASERDVATARQEYEKSLTNAERAKNVSTLYGDRNAQGEIVVKAPISGVITERKIAAGSIVRSDNADNLFTIGSIEDVWVMANIFEADLSRVKVGYDTEITTLAYPDKVFHGKIDKLGDMLDPMNKALRVRIRLSNKDRLLKPEMFTNVKITNVQGFKALEVPSSAVLFDYGKNFVVKYRDVCNIEVTEVKILKTLGEKTYLSSGVTAGEQLITKNQLLIYNALKK